MVGKALIWEEVMLSGMRRCQKVKMILQWAFDNNLCMNVQYHGNEISCLQRHHIELNINSCK